MDAKKVRVKHVPQRTCVACRETRAKRELVRIVRGADGMVEVDLTGRKAGRGAYLCPERQCWQAILAKDRLAHAFRTNIERKDLARIVEYMENLPVEEE